MSPSWSSAKSIAAPAPFRDGDGFSSSRGRSGCFFGVFFRRVLLLLLAPFPLLAGPLGRVPGLLGRFPGLLGRFPAALGGLPGGDPALQLGRLLRGEGGGSLARKLLESPLPLGGHLDGRVLQDGELADRLLALNSHRGDR